MNSSVENIFPRESDIPQQFRIEEITQREYLVDGEIRFWPGDLREVLSPVYVGTDGSLAQKKLGAYPSLGEKEALEELASAKKAYSSGRGEWPTMSVEGRINCVLDFAARMKKKREEVVRVLMWEICKTYADACKEFDRTLDYIIATVDALKNLDRDSSRLILEGGIAAQIRRAPLGIALCMGPFNYPLNETFTTLIPALIMGNTAIFKPAKFGALLFQPLLEAFRDCFPKGVVNTLYGEGQSVVPPIMSSGDIDVFAFIGSAKVANTLEKLHPRPNRLRNVYGLGAKNPAIVLSSADIDLSARECAMGALSYNGQRCTALKIIFVERAIATVFLEKLSSLVTAMKAGMPWQEGISITPLPENNKTKAMRELIDDALAKGADIVNVDGGRVNKTLMIPAILYPVNRDMKVYSVEQFGPIVPIVPFDKIEEPLSYIIESEYGQQASIFGNDPRMIGQLIDPIVNQVCRLNLNCQCQRGPDSFPFTGRKDSAEGTLSVSDALRVFSIRSLVATKTDTANKELLASILRDRHSNFLNTDYIL